MIHLFLMSKLLRFQCTIAIMLHKIHFSHGNQKDYTILQKYNRLHILDYTV